MNQDPDTSISGGPGGPGGAATGGGAPHAIILAAGKGTRMGGDLPKVLYPVADLPLVWWVVRACKQAGVSRCVVVVGYKGKDVEAALQDEPGCEFVEQREQLGTGHATQMAQPCFEGQPPVDVLVMAGDAPLIQPATLQQLIEVHRSTQASVTLATSRLDDPTGYGRVIREPDGSFAAIVEHKDATAQQREVKEINPSYYCFRSDQLFETLGEVKNTNAQREFYLTDAPGLLKEKGQSVQLVDAVSAKEVIGVNTPQQLAEVDQILRDRLAQTTGGKVNSEQPL